MVRPKYCIITMEVILFYSDNICQNIGLNVLENNLIGILFFTNIPIVI